MSGTEKTTKRYFAWDPLSDPEFAPLIIGDGHVGGKGRSLLYAIHTLRNSGDESLARTALPRSLFLSVNTFYDFLRQIPDFSPSAALLHPEETEKLFLATPLPENALLALRTFLAEVDDPLVVRSSSVLEDSVIHSFAGKYLSTFFGNVTNDLDVRMSAVTTSIKRIYARTFFQKAVSYREKHGLGEDAMGIIVMRMAGKWRGRYFYPTTGGVAYSKNFRRWSTRLRAEDGVVRLVFGLGTMSTKRGYARTYSLTNPNLRPEGQNPYKIMRHAQEHFQAVDREHPDDLTTLDVKKCWKQIYPFHRDLSTYAQVYHPDPDGGTFMALCPLSELSEGFSKICLTFEEFPRKYPRFFSRMKKTLALLEQAMGVPADVEFAYEPEEDHLELLQSRPLWQAQSEPCTDIPETPDRRVILKADRMVTNGAVTDVPYLVYVDHRVYAVAENFFAVARSVGRVNQQLSGNKFIFVSPGRVGSSNPELGVPVQYHELTNCCCIVELGIPKLGYMPELSYGTHFFSDLEVDNVLYMPVYDGEKRNIFDESWFDGMPFELGPHDAIRIYKGHFSVYMNGESNEGVILADNNGTGVNDEPGRP